MRKTKHEMIIDALGGAPIAGLVDDWLFYINEVSPNIFRADGKDRQGHVVYSVGFDAEKVLDECVLRAERIKEFNDRLQRIRNILARLFKSRD